MTNKTQYTEQQEEQEQPVAFKQAVHAPLTWKGWLLVAIGFLVVLIFLHYANQ